MKIIVVFIKEILESVFRWCRLLSSGVLFNIKHPEIVSDLKDDGIFIMPNFLSEEKINKYKTLIDMYINSGTVNIWRDDQGADERLYFIDEIDQDFKKYYETPFFREVLKEYTGVSNPHGMLLAGKISSKDGNLGSGGGWHRDSVYLHQFKSICYLTDVDSCNGPFMYIKKSNNKFRMLKQYLSGIIKFEQSRFTDSEVEIYLTKTLQKVEEVTAGAGSLVFADTKGIHRGKPIEIGERYVLFCYFWGGEIPKHFNELKQI